MSRYVANDLIVITNKSQDWAGLYINRKKYTEGRDLYTDDWMNLIKEYKSFSGVIKQYVISDEDMEKIAVAGLPNRFSDISTLILEGAQDG